MRARTLIIALFTLIAGWASTAGATVVTQLSLTDLDRSASLVVQGEVVTVESYWQDGLILSEVTIAVTECYTGDCGETVTVTQVGGQVGDIAQQVQGAAQYEPGHQVFAFLRSEANGRLATVGLAQGLFRVERVDDSILAWADHSGLQLLDRHGQLHDGVDHVVYHLADLIYAVQYDLPVLPMSPTELPEISQFASHTH